MALQVAFIGLGVMGYPMAGHLATAGHRVTVYNRTGSTVQKWLSEFSGQQAATPAAASEKADYVFCCVGNDEDVKAVTLGPDGAFQTMQPGSVFIDNTTTSAVLARALFLEAKQKQFGFLDAPVSGGQVGAENGKLTVMVGGEQTDFDKAKPLIECFSQKVKLLGESGSGQLTKMVNQICIAVVVQGLSEALRFGQNAGLNMLEVVDVISKGAAQSWQMENRSETMLANQFDFGFAVDWMRKDLAIALDEAKRNGSALPIAQIVDDYYRDVQSAGGNRWDTSSLITRLPHSASK